MTDLQDLFEDISVKAESISGILLLISAAVHEDCTAAALNYLSDAVRELERIADNGIDCIIHSRTEPQSAA